MTRKQARLYGIILFMFGLGIATALTLTALSNSISYFRTPTDVLSGHYPEQASGHAFRIGGLVEKGSLQRQDNIISFRITDLKNTLAVRYAGIVPNLFREGQGVVAEGKMDAGEGVFAATTLLAKHDEKYMPPEVARALKNNAPKASP